MELHEQRFTATRRTGEVTALTISPTEAKAVYVFAHGAGAGMRHPFMDAVARGLAARHIATFRYQFPYTEGGKRRPDPQPVLLATVRAAQEAAKLAFPGLPVFAGGKSMGGRMTSLAAAEGGLDDVRGLVFFGFPLHAAGRRSTERADHLSGFDLPMLFLQGTRDSLADLALLEPVCAGLGARATLHVIPDADHGFHVPKRSGLTDAEVLDALAAAAHDWIRQHA